ncbi:MAG: hypothetical protein HYX84_08200 [Chloroflexi bacterium]|nr:hypothetical protein [Chloroflexota bacterium]
MKNMKAKTGLLLVLVGLVGLGGFPALGQEGPVTLKSVSIGNQFPDGVLFQVAAETAAPAQIREIRLEMKVKGSTRSAYAYLKFTPATSVEGEYLLKTGGADYKPPGTLIEYFFVITDSEKRTLETPRETYLYLDKRFEWSHVANGPVEVYYYGPTKSRADLILNAAVQTIENMGATLGVKLDKTIRIVAYNNVRDLLGAQPFESRLFETEVLREGLAFGEYGVLLIRADSGEPDGVASHEMTHAVVRKAAGEFNQALPSWLNEGLAEYGNVNPGAGFDVVLSQAISSGQLVPLRNMGTIPGTSREIFLVYAQGRAVVKFLVDTHGADKLRALFVEFRKGQRIDAALQAVYGFDQDGLDNEWRRSQGLPPVEPSQQVGPAPSPVVTPTPTPPAPPPRRPVFGCAGPR